VTNKPESLTFERLLEGEVQVSLINEPVEEPKRDSAGNAALVHVPKGRSHEVGFTKKLKPYFSKTDFAVWVCKNEKYRTASSLCICS
jgi:hypothetical protein